MKRYRTLKPKKGPNVKNYEHARRELKKISALLKRLIVHYQRETFSTQQFGAILGIAAQVDAATRDVT